MKEKIRKFLKDNNFLPLTKWRTFEVIHKSIPPKNKENKNDLNSIKNHVSGGKGLYIYEKDRRIIYIGKGNPLFNRIKNHYISAYQEVPGDTKDKIFHKFFSSKRNLGKLKIYWKKEREEKVRLIIEKMLDYTLSPTFNSFKEKYDC